MTRPRDIALLSPEANTGFLLAESNALKGYLKGIKIPQRGKADKEVPVYFRWPSSERTIKYPFITIDLLSIDPAYDLWHSVVDPLKNPALFEDARAKTSTVGMYFPSVTPTALPEGVDIEDAGGLGYELGEYLPYRLMYQITAHATHAMDDHLMTAKMLVDRFPPRSFFIGVEADQTWRRGELIQWVSADTQETTENSNRVFRKIYTITMETEIPTSTLSEVGIVERLHVDIHDTQSQTPLPVGHDTYGDHSSIADHFTTTAEDL